MMSKELEALTILKNIIILKDFEDENGTKRVVFASEVYKKQFEIIETKLKENEYLKTELLGQSQELNVKNKALKIISQNFKLVGNCLHAKNKYAESGWVFVKEIEDEEELEAWKDVLL